MYRGAWAEWEIENIEMAVPFSPEELRAPWYLERTFHGYLPEKILWEEAYPTRVWLSPPVFAASPSVHPHKYIISIGFIQYDHIRL